MSGRSDRTARARTAKVCRPILSLSLWRRGAGLERLAVDAALECRAGGCEAKAKDTFASPSVEETFFFGVLTSVVSGGPRWLYATKASSRRSRSAPPWAPSRRSWWSPPGHTVAVIRWPEVERGTGPQGRARAGAGVQRHRQSFLGGAFHLGRRRGRRRGRGGRPMMIGVAVCGAKPGLRPTSSTVMSLTPSLPLA